MPVKHCCYGTCNSDSRYLSIREDLVGVFFIPFPKPKTQLEKCQRWLRLCGRQFFDVNNVRKETYICSKHFYGGNGPTENHPDPIPASATNSEMELKAKKTKRTAPVRRRVDHQEDENEGRPVKVKKDGSTSVLSEHNYCNFLNSTRPNIEGNCEQIFKITSEDNEVDEVDAVDVNQCLQHGQDCETVFQGLSLSMFAFLFSWIGDKASNLNYWRGQDTSENKCKQRTGPRRKLNIKEEFILTLVRLRRGLDVEVLGYMFGIHSSSISRIFTTWLNFLYLELNFLISWPTKEQVKANLPVQFKYFPKTRAIIDCTEFFVQKPSLPSYQCLTWSHYKHHNTLKALISITPTGTFSFISKLYSGNISDKSIVEKSGFLDMIEHGDDVMADRGFLIRGLLASRYATLNIPPFSLGKQLSSKAVTKTRRIASVRIHVERAIGRLKNFKILQGILPLKLHPLFDQIIIVCAALCNLDAKLVK